MEILGNSVGLGAVDTVLSLGLSITCCDIFGSTPPGFKYPPMPKDGVELKGEGEARGAFDLDITNQYVKCIHMWSNETWQSKSFDYRCFSMFFPFTCRFIADIPARHV